MAIAMIFMVRSNHLGQVLLRDQIFPPALLRNLDAAHTSPEQIQERGFNLNGHGRRQSRRDGTACGNHCQRRRYK